MKTSDLIPEPATQQRRSGGRARYRVWLLALCALAITAGALLFFTNGNRPTGTSAAPVVASVSMRDVQFYPAMLEVSKGTVVEWKNDDIIPHTATSSSFDSALVASGNSWRHTFTEAGTFPYVCTFHPHMKGVVIVK